VGPGSEEDHKRVIRFDSDGAHRLSMPASLHSWRNLRNGIESGVREEFRQHGPTHAAVKTAQHPSTEDIDRSGEDGTAPQPRLNDAKYQEEYVLEGATSHKWTSGEQVSGFRVTRAGPRFWQSSRPELASACAPEPYRLRTRRDTDPIPARSRPAQCLIRRLI